MSQDKAYEAVNEAILAALERGVVPWHKPWSATGNEPRSIHGRPYRGINRLLLEMQGREDPRWLTYEQALNMGGHVRKGEKGIRVILWHPVSRLVKVDPDGGEGSEEERKQYLLLKYYVVFNVEQCDDLNVKPYERVKPRNDGEAIAACEDIVKGMPNPPIIKENGGSRAYYSPSEDRIAIPSRETFDSMAEYYSTLFHEMVHSTGHRDRCDRPDFHAISHFGSDNYGREELVAEMGNAFLSAEAGISQRTLDNSAAYIANWIAAIHEDPRCLVHAAARAQKAADYILNRAEKAEKEN